MTCETCIISWAAYVYTCGTVYPGFFFFACHKIGENGEICNFFSFAPVIFVI